MKSFMESRLFWNYELDRKKEIVKFEDVEERKLAIRDTSEIIDSDVTI
jgi:hypothetical protein